MFGQGPLVFSQSSWPSRKLPTAYTHFPPGFLYGSLKNWEVLGTGPTGDAPSLPSCCRSRLGKTRMDPSFKERERKKKNKRREERKEKSVGPSFHNSTAEGLEFGRGGGWSRGNLILKSIGGSEEALLRQHYGFNLDFISGSGLLSASLWFQLNL